MTVQEALKAVKGGLEVYLNDYPELTYPIELHKIVIKALEYRVKMGAEPMCDAVAWDLGCRYQCPRCGMAIGVNEIEGGDFTGFDNYCGNCGQAIDWRKV